jgi:hypothetical protein
VNSDITRTTELVKASSVRWLTDFRRQLGRPRTGPAGHSRLVRWLGSPDEPDQQLPIPLPVPESTFLASV